VTTTIYMVLGIIVMAYFFFANLRNLWLRQNKLEKKVDAKLEEVYATLELLRKK